MSRISIFIGTVFANSREVAESVKTELEKAHFEVESFEQGTIDDFKKADNLIFCSSTTGSGDIPDELAELYYQLGEEFPLISGRSFAVIGLGDSSFGETFCAAGKKLDSLLEELQGQRIMPFLCFDAIETVEPEVDVLKWVPEYVMALKNHLGIH